MKHKAVLGTGFCLIFTAVFCGIFMFFTRRCNMIDISGMPVLQADSGAFFTISEIQRKQGRADIFAYADAPEIRYGYENFTMGKGEGVYRNITILLADSDGKTAYTLPTYPTEVSDNTIPGAISVFAENAAATPDEIMSTDFKLIAYAPDQIIEKGFDRLAVMFRGRDGEAYLLYAEEGYFE